MTDHGMMSNNLVQHIGGCRIRRWAQLVTGEILTAGGLGWCLRPAFKEHPNTWTTLAVFVVVSTGISLTRSAIRDAYIYYRTLPAPVSPWIRNLVLTDSNQIPKSDEELFTKAVEKLATVAYMFDYSAGKCDSCKDLIEKLHSTLFQFTEHIKSNRDSPPQLLKLLKETSRDYKAKHGYPDVVTRYREVMPDSSVQLVGEISTVLRIRKRYVDCLIKQPPIGGRNILNLSNNCLSDLCADINKELRIQIANVATAVLVLFEKVWEDEAKEFLYIIRKIADPFISCKAERNTVKVLENLLYYSEPEVWEK